MTYTSPERILLFNLATDADDSNLGFTTRWLQVLAERVEFIDVITMRAGRLDMPDNVRVYSAGKEQGYSELRRVIEFYRLLWMLLRQHRYTGCFAHMMPLFAVLAAPVLRLQRIPIILWYTHKSVTFTLRAATRLVNRVVTASPESFRIASPKVRVIGHGIDTDLFIPLSQEERGQCPFTILTIGRLSQSKRVDVLLNAIAMFRQQQIDQPLRVQIVGNPHTDADRAYVADLRRQVASSQLSDVVNFVGGVAYQQVISYYQSADCFVSASNTGSLDKAVLEAMSCGLTVITGEVYADVLGRELAQTWVVAPDARQICDRLQRVAAMSVDERQRLGTHLRAIVLRDHALAQLCDRLLTEFRTLAGAVYAH